MNAKELRELDFQIGERMRELDAMKARKETETRLYWDLLQQQVADCRKRNAALFYAVAP